MSFMFFLPNILLSGFMFPFRGMPDWAQWIGEALPLTHYLRIVRAIMLKGATLENLQYDSLVLLGLTLFAMTVATGLLVMAIALMLVWGLLLLFSVAVFHRETILTRWK